MPTTTGTTPQRGIDPAASTVPKPGVTVPWQLSARTRAWLADRPQTRKLVRAIWDELAELERAGNHPPDILATVRYLMLQGFYTGPPVGPGKPSAGRHAARSAL